MFTVSFCYVVSREKIIITQIIVIISHYIISRRYEVKIRDQMYLDNVE